MKITAKQTALASLASMAMVLGLGIAFIPSVNEGMIMSRAAIEDTTGGLIRFSADNAVKSGTTTTTTAQTQSGGTIICKTFDNDLSQPASGTVGSMVIGSSIRFYEADGETEYTFEDLDKISFIYESKFGFWLHVTHTDGTEIRYGSSGNTSPYATSAVKTSGERPIDFSSYSNVSNIWVECTSTPSNIAPMSEIKITYNCTSKQQTGVEVSSSPTRKVYAVGETFDPTGMIVKDVYSNEMKIATTSYSISPARALTLDDTEVVISHNGFQTIVPIVVGAQNTGLTNSYSLLSSGNTYRFNFSTKTYKCNSSATINFSYIYSEAQQVVAFKLESGSSSYSDYSTNYRLFGSTDTVGAINEDAYFDKDGDLQVFINNYYRRYIKQL